MQIFDQWESEIRGYCRSYPTVFARAINARQFDEQGKEYIDFFAGAGVLNFGHNNPHMKEAVISFLQNNGVTHSLDMATSVKRDFIKAFVETILLPRKMEYKLQFVGPTGSNAVEAALKLARRVTGRTDVVACGQGFHGMTLGALACTANAYFRNAAGVPLNNVTHIPFESGPGGGMQNLHDLRVAYQSGSSGTDLPAAFLVETIQAEGGVNIASKEWLQGVQALAHDLGALFIIDDIQVGCGRTGQYFSFEDLGVDPDIICLAKGIGGLGTPLAMNLIKPEHDSHWKPGEHTGTFRGQGISFVAGREALRYFENDELMQRTQERCGGITQRLEKIADEFGDGKFVVRGKGMIHGLDVADNDLAKGIARQCFDDGLLIGPCGVTSRVIKFIPPLTSTDEDIDQGFDIFSRAVAKKTGA
ncbi:aspartate aminotransferase family protein [Dasania marina]|uniref:aspartate aminotransferase family protein n=1 Tax=Dasania marina TaxID=471499 RepID=UPI0030DCCE17|tara:strand:+ start:53708 stop:54961 length:1254 start_codon:yes stop_codon:yes gene_type:complete